MSAYHLCGKEPVWLSWYIAASNSRGITDVAAAKAADTDCAACAAIIFGGHNVASTRAEHDKRERWKAEQRAKRPECGVSVGGRPLTREELSVSVEKSPCSS